MALVFHRRLAIPLWAITFFTVVLTAPPPTKVFLMPPAALFVIAVLGIAATLFIAPGLVPWWRTSLVRVVPLRHRHRTSVAITTAAGTCVGPLDKPIATRAEDALDLDRMDDDGGWQIAPPRLNATTRKWPIERLGGRS
jgi:hypothetical protein